MLYAAISRIGSVPPSLIVDSIVDMAIYPLIMWVPQSRQLSSY
jgi:hypothetical protein